MEYSEVLGILKRFIEEQIVDSPGVTLNPDTPLLEWGILNSLSTTRLIGFIHEKFDIHVPAEQMVGGNFCDLDHISQLVVTLSAELGRV